jgi:hypothetical protein
VLDRGHTNFIRVFSMTDKLGPGAQLFTHGFPISG